MTRLQELEILIPQLRIDLKRAATQVESVRECTDMSFIVKVIQITEYLTSCIEEYKTLVKK